MDNVYVHFGLPEHILSDRGTQFTGLFNQSLAERLGYSWKLTTAHAPWSDGQTERTNRIFEDVLRHFVAADKTVPALHTSSPNLSWHFESQAMHADPFSQDVPHAIPQLSAKFQSHQQLLASSLILGQAQGHLMQQQPAEKTQPPTISACNSTLQHPAARHMPGWLALAAALGQAWHGWQPHHEVRSPGTRGNLQHWI